MGKTNAPDHRCMSPSSFRFNACFFIPKTWAVCLDKYRLAEMFWLRGSEQCIAKALVASRMLLKLSEHPALTGPHMVEQRTKMVKNSRKFEALAVGVLEGCKLADADQARLALETKVKMFGNKTTVDLAHSADSLDFLSHSATQDKINKVYRSFLEQEQSENQACRRLVLKLIRILMPCSFRAGTAE